MKNKSIQRYSLTKENYVEVDFISTRRINHEEYPRLAGLHINYIQK